MILAAGLGTRLKPLTNELPKALVPVNGKPLLQRNIEYLKNSGIHDIIVNVHHHKQQILDWLEKLGDPRIKVSIEHPTLLDTAGGISYARDFFDGEDQFIVINADIISDLNIHKLLQYHKNGEALGTLAIRNRESSRKLLFDKNMHLCGWRNMRTLTTKWSRPHAFGKVRSFAFSGLQVYSTSIFKFLKHDHPQPLVPVLLQMSIMENIIGYMDNESIWMDVGNHEKLAKANDYFASIEGPRQ